MCILDTHAIPEDCVETSNANNVDPPTSSYHDLIVSGILAIGPMIHHHVDEDTLPVNSADNYSVDIPLP